jgi:stage II sporulation protein D
MRLAILFLSLLYSCACIVQQTKSTSTAVPLKTDTQPQTYSGINNNLTDQQLQQAVTAALGEREGAILIIDPQTGRLRAVVNPRIAFAQAFPPGSTIKPFTALAALRAGLLARETQRQCSGRYARAGYEILCSHPKSQSPFKLPQALAYSCNDYFAHVGERLSGGAVNATLASFGFGKRTGVNVGESAGRLLNGEWRAREALGDSESLMVTPVQLLLAYCALVNGGRLYRPQQSEAENFTPQLIAKINLTEAQRTVLLEGMRGAVTYGTALPAKLAELSLYLFGKTGTSEASNGFQTQGWFVGFVAAARNGGVPAPDEIELGVLAFLKRSHGSQGAKVARKVLDCGLRIADCGLPAGMSGDVTQTNPQSAIRNPQSVRVHLVKENVTRELPFEAYVAGVVAAEGSTEARLEALKAQAVASRTYAWQNRARHAREGFDFCSTTHCQRFWWLAPEKLREVVRQSVERTAGQVLLDEQGRVADSYFHAACGGQTANLEALWGVKAPPHLRGVRDDYCAQRPNRNWSAEIETAQMIKALRSDPRTDVGAQLRGLEIKQRDANGRAQTLLLDGERHKAISGWDFKIIVGRSLGWSWLKSSWFDVRRSGAGFVFQGRGFGHGLGLCQEGTHVMAERGMDYRRIVEFYFPGVSVGRLPERVKAVEWLQPEPKQGVRLLPALYQRAGAIKRATLASEHFRVDYPSNVTQREAAEALQLLAASRASLLPRLEAASLRWAESAPVELFVHATTADFIAATGRAGWVAAVTRGRKIEVQPLALLQRRGLLAATLKHEFVHVVIETLSKGQTPRWLAEGLALHYAGEGQSLTRVQLKEKLSIVELERHLAKPANAAVTRVLYAQAYREVQSLLRAEGEAGVWRRVAAR